MQYDTVSRRAVFPRFFGAIFFLLSIAPRAGADVLFDSINAAANTSNATFTSSNQDFGWIYTAKATFSFTALQTKFHSADNRTVTVEIFTVDQSGQGTMVRTGTLTASTSLSGAGFEALTVPAGTTIFIGMRNLAGLGVNLTADNGAVTLDTLSDSVGDGSYGTTVQGGSSPILLLFESDGPQPVVTSPAYLKGDLLADRGSLGIPADAVFSTFGLPATGHGRDIAFLAKYVSVATKGAAGKGEGIFVNGKAVALQFAAAASGAPTGASYKTLSDPVIDDAGHVAFTATLSGHGIGGSAIVTDAPGGTLAVVAASGHPAAESAAGIVWSKFTSIALPGGGRGPIFVATLAGPKLHGNQALFGVDGGGNVRRLLADGDTVAVDSTTNKTIKSFAVLKALTAVPGAGRSYNDAGDVVSMVTFTDGSQSVVRSSLP